VQDRTGSAEEHADPPGASAVSPNAVYTESSAIEPTTSRLTSHPIRGADPQEVEAVGEHLAHRRRQHEARRLLRLAQYAVLVVPGVCQTGEPFEIAGDAVRLERLGRTSDDARKAATSFSKSVSSGSTRTLRSTPAAVTEPGSRAATRKMPLIRACAI